MPHMPVPMRVATLALAVVTLPVSALAQDHQAAMGVWVLNVEKSTFEPGPKPKIQSSTFTRLPDGRIKIENDSTGADGNRSHREMTSKFDGTHEARSGSGPVVTRAYRWLDDRNFAFEERINGEASVVGRTSVSPDGRVRTLTVNGTRNGRPVHNIEVYELQR